MKAVTQEWIDKAEEDWEALKTRVNTRKKAENDALCLLAQQCAEKYLKARLVEAGVVFPNTRDLLRLFSLILPNAPSWYALHLPLFMLNNYNALCRNSDFAIARTHCETIRKVVRASLGLPV